MFYLQTARQLKSERIQRDSMNSTPIIDIAQLSYHNTLSDDDEDDIFELKSWNSNQLQTFITEPKLTRISIKESVNVKPSSSTLMFNNLDVENEMKGYKLGDFISRNKVVIFTFI
jgi:hypothetical protein